MTTDEYLSDLLHALERHTQALQANTAAVNSLISIATIPGEAERGLRVQLAEQLAEAARVADRLEMLRQSLTIGQTPAPAGSTSEDSHESSTGPHAAA